MPTLCVPNATLKSGKCYCNDGYHAINVNSPNAQCVLDSSGLSNTVKIIIAVVVIIIAVLLIGTFFIIRRRRQRAHMSTFIMASGKPMDPAMETYSASMQYGAGAIPGYSTPPYYGQDLNATSIAYPNKVYTADKFEEYAMSQNGQGENGYDQYGYPHQKRDEYSPPVNGEYVLPSHEENLPINNGEKLVANHAEYLPPINGEYSPIGEYLPPLSQAKQDEVSQPMQDGSQIDHIQSKQDESLQNDLPHARLDDSLRQDQSQLRQDEYTQSNQAQYSNMNHENIPYQKQDEYAQSNQAAEYSNMKPEDIPQPNTTENPTFPQPQHEPYSHQEPQIYSKQQYQHSLYMPALVYGQEFYDSNLNQTAYQELARLSQTPLPGTRTSYQTGDGAPSFDRPLSLMPAGGAALPHGSHTPTPSLPQSFHGHDDIYASYHDQSTPPVPSKEQNFYNNQQTRMSGNSKPGDNGPAPSTAI